MSTSVDWDALRAAIAGEVVRPGSPDYDAVRKPDIARFHDIRPQAIVLCENPGDVAEALSFARQSGVPAVPRSGGHCFAGRSTSDGMVIDVTPMRSVSLADGTATVGAGTRLGEMYDALTRHGRTIPAGCGPTVGIAGLTLGGGLGILGRKHGLTCDHLLAAQVVLADGRVVECDQHHDAELLWALRGAGHGNFGVVTSLVFSTLPAPAATAFHLLWPHDRAAALLDAWQAWAPDGPEELAASLLVTATAEADQPAVVKVFGAMLGTEADTAELLDELAVRAGVEPTSTELKHLSHRETKRYLAEAGPTEERPLGHGYIKSEFFARPLPAETVTALVDHLARERVAGQSRELDFSPWAGAYNRVRADATAFAHRDARFLLKHAVVVDPDATGAQRQAARRWLERSWELVHPWGTGGVYPNFPDPDLEDPASAYYGTNYDRLVRVKARYDPGDFFRPDEGALKPM
jgi:FAD/FMN-containing dehydrogenase